MGEPDAELWPREGCPHYVDRAFPWFRRSPCQPCASHQQLGGLQQVQHPVISTAYHRLLASYVELHHSVAGFQVAYGQWLYHHVEPSLVYSWLAERHRIAIRFPAQRLTPVEFSA